MPRVATFITLAVFLLTPAVTRAQDRAGFLLSREAAKAMAADAVRAARFAQAQPVRKDSLKNGALIGMVIGAASLGAFAWFLTSTDEACGCKGDIARGAALGAGIGAGIGVGIDALRDRRTSLVARGPGVRFSMKF